MSPLGLPASVQWVEGVAFFVPMVVFVALLVRVSRKTDDKQDQDESTD